jgi:hypothetical protein
MNAPPTTGSLKLVDPAKETSEAFEDESWPDPISLGPPDPDPIPIDGLPDWMRKHIESVSGFTQTPRDLPTLLCLASVSVALAGKVKIRVRQKWMEYLNIYSACILGPANRKSPVLSMMSDALIKWEAKKHGETKEPRAEALHAQSLLKKKLAKAEKDFVNGEGSTEAVKKARWDLSQIFVPPLPRLLVSDITGERLAQIMAENFGRIAVMNAEGDPLRVLAGRYTNGETTLEILKKGWTGDEPFRDDRMGRDGTHIPNPIIVTGMAFQPAVLSTLRNAEIFSGEGVFARFLYSVPPENLGKRKTGESVPPLDEDAAEEFSKKLRALLYSDPFHKDEEAGVWVPFTLDLSEEARSSLHVFEQEVEQMLGPGGTLNSIEAWGGKLVGNAVRIAGIIHIATLLEKDLPWKDSKVPVGAMNAAISIGHALISHAHVVFGDLLDRDERRKLARYVLTRAKAVAERETLTERNLFQACKSKRGISTMTDLRDYLRVLEAHHLVQVIRQESTGGRPASPLIHLNPKLSENIPKSLKSPVRSGGKEGDK